MSVFKIGTGSLSRSLNTKRVFTYLWDYQSSGPSVQHCVPYRQPVTDRPTDRPVALSITFITYSARLPDRVSYSKCYICDSLFCLCGLWALVTALCYVPTVCCRHICSWNKILYDELLLPELVKKILATGNILKYSTTIGPNYGPY